MAWEGIIGVAKKAAAKRVKVFGANTSALVVILAVLSVGAFAAGGFLLMNQTTNIEVTESFSVMALNDSGHWGIIQTPAVIELANVSIYPGETTTWDFSVQNGGSADLGAILTISSSNEDLNFTHICTPGSIGLEYTENGGDYEFLIPADNGWYNLTMAAQVSGSAEPVEGTETTITMSRKEALTTYDYICSE